MFSNEVDPNEINAFNMVVKLFWSDTTVAGVKVLFIIIKTVNWGFTGPNTKDAYFRVKIL